MTGEQMKTQIFMGPTYYQRIKLMVADKMHSRSTGPKQSLTRQPVGGRSNNGGGRIGEMERDSIISHGISSFLNEILKFTNKNKPYQPNFTTSDKLIAKHQLKVRFN